MTGNIDAFARLRVSEPITLFDSQLQYNAQPLLWETAGANPLALSLVCTGIGGTATAHGAMSWRELY